MSNGEAMLLLEGRQPIGFGGNRLCFRHPLVPRIRVKVDRPDRTPKLRRASKAFPKNFLPVTYYDENVVEARTLDYLHRAFPTPIRAHIPKSFGLLTTDLGTGHLTELVSDESGEVSENLEAYISGNGIDEAISAAIEEFKRNWSERTPRTRNLLPHNFVVQRRGHKLRLWLIDGFGRMPRMVALDLEVARKRLFNCRIAYFEDRINRIQHGQRSRIQTSETSF